MSRRIASRERFRRTRKSSPLEVIGGIQVKHDTRIIDARVSHPPGIGIDDGPGASILGRVEQFFEQRPRKEYRMAPAPMVASHDNRLAGLSMFIEYGAEGRREDRRMVREMDQGGGVRVSQRAKARFDRGQLAALEVGIEDHGDSGVGRNCRTHAVGVGANYHYYSRQDFKHRDNDSFDEGAIAKTKERLRIAHSP